MHRKFVLPMIAMLFYFNSPYQAQQVMAMPEASTPVNAPTVTGTILETMNASGYTYMLIDSGKEKNWVAIPTTTVVNGATVNYYEGMEMKNFTSKTLDRTFESVIFSPGLADEKAETVQQLAADTTKDSFSEAVKAEKMSPVATMPMEKSPGSAGAIVPLEEISIEKATGANGYTVGEIFARGKELAGQKVQVQGQVVKFNPLIMGKNWIHLQDGTGNPMNNSHDLVVTSTETVAVNDIVTIEGTLAADKDFGAGYRYEVIIEDAAITK